MSDEPIEEPNSIRNEITFALMAIRDMLEPIVEEVEGYRQKMLADNYTAEQARQMAVDYHAAVLRTLIK